MTLGNKGKLSYPEILGITDLGTIFKDNKLIAGFPELKDLVGIKNLSDDAFSGSTLTEVELPKMLITLGNRSFKSSQLTSLVIPKKCYLPLDQNVFIHAVD